jgi:hypothetical protein
VYPIESYEGDSAVGTPPQVFSSPGPAAMLYGGYPKAFSIALAADQPGTQIYYTTDGTPPDLTSPTTANATTPVRGITISATATVQFFGVQDGAQATTTTEAFSIDAAMAQTNAGYLVTNVTLDGTSPVVIAAPGSVLAARANVQAWVQTSCTGCAAQVVYGVGDTDQGCLFAGNPGVYPGITTNNKMFDVTVPATPGVHELRIAHIEETSCTAAMVAMALKTRPTITRIGAIIVR